MRSVEIRNGRLFYYGSAVGYLEGDGLTADPMFRREDLERWLERKCQSGMTSNAAPVA